jgi:hypothetical protein
VVETLPGGFSYVSSSLGEDAEESGGMVTFTLLEDPKTFTYTVTAPSTPGPHTFMGSVENSRAAIPSATSTTSRLAGMMW